MSKTSELSISVAVIVILIGIMIWRAGAGHGTTDLATSGLNHPAPDVSSLTLNNQTWRLRDQHGKVVLIDFWATWCGPCVASMPHMKEIYQKFSDHRDFLMVGVSLDGNPQQVADFCKRRDMPWLQLTEPHRTWDNSFSHAFRIEGIPSVWLIDRDGNIAGADLQPDELESRIASLLGASAQPKS